MVTRAFKDVKLNEKQPMESCWNVYAPDTSQGSSFCHYFSYFLLSVFGSTPFEITRGIYSQQINYVHANYRHIPGIDLACLATCS